MYTQIIENLPENIRWPMIQLGEQIREDLDRTVTEDGFRTLQKDIDDRVDTLNACQSNTERYLEQLAQAQVQTELRLEELTQAQAQTEKRMDQLTDRMDHQLAVRMDRLAEAQEKTD